MKIFKLAEILAIKHKMAINEVDLESSLRKKIPILWSYPNKLFTILKACADSRVTHAKNADEKKVQAGYKFCKDLIDTIDDIYDNWTNIDLGHLKDKLQHIVEIISTNKELKFDSKGREALTSDPKTVLDVQFPHVSELIFALYPVSRRSDVKIRSDLQSKARTGLSRILSISLSILEELSQLELMSPERFVNQKDDDPEDEDFKSLPKRFIPQRAQLSLNDTIDFIRAHGDEYGIKSTDDWARTFLDDPILKREMTTVINAINRGHSPKDSYYVKKEIEDILKRHRERKAASNAHLFEDAE